MYACIIITLKNRRDIEAHDDVGRRHDNEEIARQVARMLIINRCVFFLLHVPVSFHFFYS